MWIIFYKINQYYETDSKNIFIFILFNFDVYWFCLFSDWIWLFREAKTGKKREEGEGYFNYDSYDRNYPGTKEYFNEDGNIVKIEYFAGRVANNDYKLYSEIIVNNFDTRGNLSGYDVIYYEGGSSKNNFENVTPSYFWDIGVMEETLVERVEYIFDKNGNVKKLLSYGDHAYPKEILMKFSVIKMGNWI